MYESDWVNVHLDDVELPDATHLDHHVITFPKGSQTAVITNSTHTQVLLIWRHRFTTDRWGWEVPAGWVEAGEDSETAIRREVLEETGYEIASLRPLLEYDAIPGISTMKFVTWQGLVAEKATQDDKNEVSGVRWVPLAQVREYLTNGTIRDGPSITALAVFLSTFEHYKGLDKRISVETIDRTATMSVTTSAGFWSYTHRDDELDEGRILRLAKKLQAEYELITGEELRIFVDKQDLAWGDEWKARIDEALIGTTFFIPIITPKYFQSAECRRELILFADQAESLGVTELLLPILYLDVPALDEDTDDEAIGKIKKTHRVDWTDLRLVDESSARYRQQINNLAKRLAEIAAVVAERPTVSPEETASLDADDELPEGFYESMAAAEAHLPEWQTIIVRIGELSRQVGEAMEEATADVAESDRRNAGFAGRLRVARKLATTLSPLATEMDDLANQYSSTLVSLNSGVLTMIRLLSESASKDSEELAAASDLFTVVNEVATISGDNVATIGTFRDSLASIGQLDRGLGRETRRIKGALQKIVDGQAVMDEWRQRIASSGVDLPISTDAG
jgi:8-oxo-dGTP pyrophosphatase MutT (NUDIX family)